ncbi:SDR family NAD(P)-dependent oxidoreductase [Aspergillus mulundensis]|uniref:Putative short chain dehydrogenase n=1 Tax=Aspergillus mulundensis TaxID=1810919 RepID=A0A3D8RXV8_9EURO|nr:putative short chain dehydrogenase [Aspergillus mulundensis]RDW78865.1 putative short chain dehydrogenase [Aspergillus mulundensis]
MSLEISTLFSVKGRVAVVTGGSSGIGLMIAKAPQGLVTNGANVYIVALPTDPITPTVSTLNALATQTLSSGSAHGYACDLSSKAAIANLAAYISSRENGTLDILVSNAGIRRDPPVQCDVLTAPLSTLQESMFSRTEEDWEDTFNINTTAHYFLGVAFLPLLAQAAAAGPGGDGSRCMGAGRGAEEGRGVMLVMSSCASMHNVTNVDLSSYAASKAATDHLVRLLAAKFARWYVRVVGVNPGCALLMRDAVVPSKMNPVGAEGNMFAGLFDKVPARRAGREEDLAGTVLYLVSKAGAYVDGVSLCVDGGRVLVANGQE